MKASEFLGKLNLLTRDDLLSIKGIGDVLADNFIDFLESDRYQRLIKGFGDLETQGKAVEIESSDKPLATNLALSGQTIVITGSFDISRDNIKEMLENLGAKVTDSVSSATTTLLAGEKAGSKLDKAEKLGVKNRQ